MLPVLTVATATIGSMLLKVGFGFLLGFAVGLTSIGGGILLMAILLKGFQFALPMAVGTTALFQVLTRGTGMIGHVRLKNVEWDLSFRVLAGAVIPSFFFSTWVIANGTNEKITLILEWVIAVIMAFTLISILLQVARQKKSSPAEEASSTLSEESFLWRKKTLVLWGIPLGVLQGLTALGAGVLVVAILSLFLKLKTRKIVGTSLFVVLALSLLSTSIHIFRGTANIQTALTLALGSLPGVVLGSQLSAKIPDKPLKIALSLALGITLTLFLAL